MKPIPLLAAALAYVRRGLPVIPLHTPKDGICSCALGKDCSNAGKHPRTLHGLKDATTDEARIREWWGKWPNANVGVLTGESAGLVVLDIDPRHGGDETLAKLEAEHGPLPEAPVVLTGGGGRHYYFRHPGGYIKSVAGALGPGLDVKGEGGFVVAPPSLHASGRRYEWSQANE